MFQLVLARVGGYRANHPGVGTHTPIVGRTFGAPPLYGRLGIELPVMRYSLTLWSMEHLAPEGRTRTDHPARGFGSSHWDCIAGVSGLTLVIQPDASISPFGILG